MDIRKIATYRETLLAEAGALALEPITRVAAAGIVASPYAGCFECDLSRLFDIGVELDQILSKATIVGVNGDVEHGHAMLHPKLGQSMRKPIGDGAALIPSAVKLATAGVAFDVPMGRMDDAWSLMP